MSTWSAITLFFLSVALSVVSSMVLATGLEWQDGSSTFLRDCRDSYRRWVPMRRNRRRHRGAIHGSADMGIGVVFGSNIFNLAALMGLSAVVAGQVRVHRRGRLLNGGVAVLVALVALSLILQWVSAWVAPAVLSVVLIPYTIVLSLSGGRVGGSSQQQTDANSRCVGQHTRCRRTAAKTAHLLKPRPAICSRSSRH